MRTSQGSFERSPDALAGIRGRERGREEEGDGREIGKGGKLREGRKGERRGGGRLGQGTGVVPSFNSESPVIPNYTARKIGTTC